jgi:hypothetical protein
MSPVRRANRFPLPIALLAQCLVCVLTLAASTVVAHSQHGEVASIPVDQLVRSVQSGNWSDKSTWEKGHVPQPGDRVQIRTGHHVVYDVESDQAIRLLHIAGTLQFATDRNTRLDVGLVRIEAGEKASEDGFDCNHAPASGHTGPRPALLVGTPEQPVRDDARALIRLVYFEGMDRQSCPAIVSCGGRMDFHGAPLNRTWVKLGKTAFPEDRTVELAEAVTGWKAGDRVILTATNHTSTGGTRRPGTASSGRRTSKPAYTEERTIVAVDGTRLVLDAPLQHEHLAEGRYRGEVANLSRNVIVESADPDGVRGHTMYHVGSAGSISYAEFRHLGKENTLGRYALHYHLVGNTMRGSYVVGASIWDSHNRWLTIHGTNYLVVRDNVGYQSVGHGFFLEDGTEVFNLLDRNLAVQAFLGRKLPKQELPFDQNDGAGFWWGNSHNTFTRNVAVENDRYGFRKEATGSRSFPVEFSVLRPDGRHEKLDIRTLPFIRFEDNETHSNGFYGVNLGEGVGRVGPDAEHPSIVRNLLIWNLHYAFRPQVRSLLAEDVHIHHAAYGIYHPNYDDHVYRNLVISHTNTEPFNRGHDDRSVQYGPLTVDGLTIIGTRPNSRVPVIQISDQNPDGHAVSHFRNVEILDRQDGDRRALVNRGGGPRPRPTSPQGVPIFLHDWYGPGRHAKVVSTAANDFPGASGGYREDPPLTGDESRVAEVSDVEFPELLQPIDDLPPMTVITSITAQGDQWLVRGVTHDNGTVQQVTVNDRQAKIQAVHAGGVADWQITLPKTDTKLRAWATDAAGNQEQLPHEAMAPR